MKIQQQRRIKQRLWGWGCLSINCLIISIFLAEKTANILGIGTLLSISIVCQGVVKTSADKSKGDLSGASVAKDYICMSILTFLSTLKASEYLSSYVVLIAVTIASIIESLIFVVITYWHTIRRFLAKNKSNQN